MLKHDLDCKKHLKQGPAAFGRLRVETLYSWRLLEKFEPAAFGRLRVETAQAVNPNNKANPAAFGRLRVETFRIGNGQ